MTETRVGDLMRGAPLFGGQMSRVDEELRPALQALLEAYPGGLGAILDLRERRRVEADLAREFNTIVDKTRTCATEDVLIPAADGTVQLAARIYRPERLREGGPAVHFIHGGGMVSGNIDAEHATAVRVCQELGVVVVSADYRKAPEHPHPTPVDDCFTALCWIARNEDLLGHDPSRLAVWGGSAGGNLSLATAMKARDMSGPAIAFVLAAYPMVDHRHTLPSTHEITALGLWDRARSVEAWNLFLGGAEPDGYAAPLHARLQGMPPTFIDVGSIDLFRDEAHEIAGVLLRSGVETEFHLYPGVYHAAELFTPTASVSVAIWERRMAAARRALRMGLDGIRDAV